MFLSRWVYGGGDPGLKLFTLANPLLPAVSHPDVLEIGSHDTDWVQRARHADPSMSVHGVDWRGGLGVVKADILTWECAFRKDAVVSLSAIEHIGLGHYDSDPLDPHGDIKTIQRVRDWLRPGGFCYFDVPYTPEGYQVIGTKCRCYDDQRLLERFGPHEVLGYTDLSVNGWIEKPTRNNANGRPFGYVALLIRKD